jgi:hypothetical protein
VTEIEVWHRLVRKYLRFRELGFPCGVRSDDPAIDDEISDLHAELALYDSYVESVVRRIV